MKAILLLLVPLLLHLSVPIYLLSVVNAFKVCTIWLFIWYMISSTQTVYLVLSVLYMAAGVERKALDALHKSYIVLVLVLFIGWTLYHGEAFCFQNSEYIKTEFHISLITSSVLFFIFTWFVCIHPAEFDSDSESVV